MSATLPAWLHRFPLLAAIDDPAGLALLREAREIDLPENVVVFHPHDECANYLLVLEGSVRVQQITPNGREIVLYRVQAGDSCILTTSCLLGNTRYCAEGVTETPVHAIAIPVSRFREGVDQSSGFRRFVFASFGRRLADLMQVVENVAFERIDTRLARRLLELAGDSGTLNLTHQDLAVELGTAREVISRMLKDFEHKGLVRLARGSIEIADREGLTAIGAYPASTGRR